MQETENVINTHGIYIYHFKEVFPANYDVNRDPGIVVVDRIHRSIKISKQSKVEQGIADLMAFLNSMYTCMYSGIPLNRQRLNCPNLYSSFTNKYVLYFHWKKKNKY